MSELPSFSKHVYRTGQHYGTPADIPDAAGPHELRKQIEPWLTAIFQSEHLSVLLGSGLGSAIAALSDIGAPDMSAGELDLASCLADDENDITADEVAVIEDSIEKYAQNSADRMGRGAPNIEDQIRTALIARDGLNIIGDELAPVLDAGIDALFAGFLETIVTFEGSLVKAEDKPKHLAEATLVSFLMSFASRTAGRDRLSVFTTNYDRLIEYGCDLAGVRILDRFVGAISPRFRSSRMNVDMHYDPPGIRGEPRYIEGLVRLTKLHGSLDWRWVDGELRRIPVPFGADKKHARIPDTPSGSVIIYPNPAKDVETLEYPYSELFRDFAAAVCRPNSALVTYGYGFGDGHINRILEDMLSIPSTHLVIIAWDDIEDGKQSGAAVRQRIVNFCENVGREAQISLLLGPHFANMAPLVEHYLPKPAIDRITIRKQELMERRGETPQPEKEGEEDEDTD